jgi:potassium voltage-gated channel Shal-related subfamily D protein
LARIKMAKASSGAAFVSRKKAAEARILALEEAAASGQSPLIDPNDDEDIFELQHHHLLRCLEKTTVIIAFVIFCLCSTERTKKETRTKMTPAFSLSLSPSSLFH